MTKTKNNLYTIKDVSEITGVHAQTLRNWEKDELIEPIRVAGNQRIYTDQHVERVNQILNLKEEGLQLKGIRNVLLGKVRGITSSSKTTNKTKTEKPLMTAAQTLEKPKPTRKTRQTRKTSSNRTNQQSKYNIEELEKMNLKELTELARAEGVKYFRQMFKEELITAIAYPERREEMKEQAKARTKERYGHKVYGERAKTTQQNRRVQYAQKQQPTKSSNVVDEKNIQEEGLAEANVVQDHNEEMDTQQLLIKQILDLGEEGKSPEEIAKRLAEAYK